MNKRLLRDLEVSAIGFGAMGFSHGDGLVPDESDTINLMRLAYQMGCNFFDTAESYGKGHNERLVGQAIKAFRQEIILASKFKLTTEEGLSGQLKASIRRHLEASLERLDTDYLDIYYQHRINKDIPVEAIAELMGKLISEGKIKGWGQSQPTEDEVRCANSVTPLTAVQSEYSMMERMFEKDVIPACKELGIGFVAFSPFASGFLSGKYSANQQFERDDVRRVITRFDSDNMRANQPVLDLLTAVADEKGITPAQVSLAWLLHKEDFIVPIPGVRKQHRLEENFKAASVKLTEEEFEMIESALAKLTIHGNRTDEAIQKLGFLDQSHQ